MPDETFDISIDDFIEDRYSRLRSIDGWKQEDLQKAKVLVVGSGALGNEVLKNLALVGVGNIYIIDFDLIDATNLSRSILFRNDDISHGKSIVAACRLKEINPLINVKGINKNVVSEVGLGLIRRMNVVVSCLDNREARLAINKYCMRMNVPLVDGGLDSLAGIVRTFMPNRGPCYECTLSEADYDALNVRYSCAVYQNQVENVVPTTPTISSIIGAFEAQEAIKIIHSFPDSELLVGKALFINSRTYQFEKFVYQMSNICTSHENYSSIVEMKDVSANSTVIEMFSSLSKIFLSTNFILELRFEIVLSMYCYKCEKEFLVNLPLFKIKTDEYFCQQCGGMMMPIMTHYIENTSDLAKYRLHELGVPEGDILIIRQEGNFPPLFVELTSDIPLLIQIS